MNKPSIQIRQMTSQDISLGVALKNIANWNQTEEDWEFFMKTNKGGHFVSSYEGKDSGTVTSLLYDEGLCWIGMVLVDPIYRGRGSRKTFIRNCYFVWSFTWNGRFGCYTTRQKTL